MRQRFCILVSQVCLCLMRNFSPPTHPSSIFLYLHPLHAHTRLSCPSRWSGPVEDLPSQEAAGVSAQMFLSAKGAPSLEHQRGELVKHSRGKYLWQRDELLAGDSSLANVTPRDEEVAEKKKKNQIAIADILFMTLKRWHQEIKGINPNLQKNLTVAAHSMLGILLCSPNKSEFSPRNWRLRGLQIYRAWRLWKKKWGYRLNVSSVDCYLPQKALGQLDKYCYLNLPLLLWKHGKAAEIMAHSRWLKIFLFRLLWYFFYNTPCYFVLTTTFREKRGGGGSCDVVNTHSEDLAMKAS